MSSFFYFTKILKIIVILFCSIKISRIFAKEITTKNIEIMKLTVKKTFVKFLNEKDLIIYLKGKIPNSLNSISQIVELLNVDYYTININKDVYFYDKEDNVLIGILTNLGSGNIFMSYSQNVLITERKITSSTYCRSEKILQNKVNLRFKNR